MTTHDALTCRILRTVEVLLGDGRLAAGVTDPNLQVDLQMSLRLVGLLSRRAAAQAVETPAHHRGLENLAREACELLDIRAPRSSSELRLWSGGTMLAGLAPSDGRHDDSIYARVGAEMTAAASPARRAAAQAIFRRFVDLEDSYARTLDPDGESAFAPGGHALPHTTASGRRVDGARLTLYLRQRFPDFPDIGAANVRPLVGGFSKDTILFQIEGRSPLAGPAAMRKDLPVHGLRTTAVDEFAILEHCHRIGVPVPEPLWSEPDGAWFDGSFIVVREVGGSTDMGWAEDPEACRKFADQLAAAMVLIHAIRPDHLGLVDQGPSTASAAQQRHVLWIRELYRTSADRLNPRIEAAFGWLMSNRPETPAAPPSLVHSGLGFHNLMTDGGNLVAILDWEVAHFGDPADDLGYARRFIERILPWENFMAGYRQHGGSDYSPEQDRYYSVWRNLRNACSATASIGRYLGSEYESVKLPFTGLVNAPGFELQALHEIIATLAHS